MVTRWIWREASLGSGVTNPVVTTANSSRASIRGNPGQAVILKCDCHAGHTGPDPASDGVPPILYSMARHRRGAFLVACRADACGRPVDRPTDNGGAHAAPVAGLDSPGAVSRTLQIHSAQPNLGRS